MDYKVHCYRTLYNFCCQILWVWSKCSHVPSQTTTTLRTTYSSKNLKHFYNSWKPTFITWAMQETCIPSSRKKNGRPKEGVVWKEGRGQKMTVTTINERGRLKESYFIEIRKECFITNFRASVYLSSVALIEYYLKYFLFLLNKKKSWNSSIFENFCWYVWSKDVMWFQDYFIYLFWAMP